MTLFSVLSVPVVVSVSAGASGCAGIAPSFLVSPSVKPDSSFVLLSAPVVVESLKLPPSLNSVSVVSDVAGSVIAVAAAALAVSVVPSVEASVALSPAKSPPSVKPVCIAGCGIFAAAAALL